MKLPFPADFHVDENGNEAAKGLLHISKKAVDFNYQGRVVCGHCWQALFCSLCSLLRQFAHGTISRMCRQMLLAVLPHRRHAGFASLCGIQAPEGHAMLSKHHLVMQFFGGPASNGAYKNFEGHQASWSHYCVPSFGQSVDAG